MERNILPEIYEILEKEKYAISKRTLNWLNKEPINAIIAITAMTTNDGYYYFKFQPNKHISQYAINHIKAIIKKYYGLTYLYDIED